MSLSWVDVGYIVFCSACILVSFFLNYRLRKSIRDTPDESKTVIGEIHASTTFAHQTFIFSVVAPVIVRSVIGPIIPGSLILVISYSRHGSFVVTVLTLGYGALVRFGFLVSFGRMSEVSEKVVKRVMYCLCLAWVLAAVVYDLVVKWQHGKEFAGFIHFLNENQPAKDNNFQFKWFDFASLVFATLTHVLVLMAKVRRFVVILPTPTHLFTVRGQSVQKEPKM